MEEGYGLGDEVGGVRESGGGKMETTLLEQQLKKRKKKDLCSCDC